MVSNAESPRARRWYRRASRALLSGDLDAAARAAGRLLSEAPEHADGHFILGICSLDRGRPDVALPSIQKATGLSPARADYLAQEARCLAQLGRQDDALAAAERALAAGPGDALTHDTLGSVLTRIGRYTEAAGQFAGAVALEPSHPEFLYHHANGLLFCGELDRARECFEGVLRLDQDHVHAHLALSELLTGPPPAGRIGMLEAALARAAGDVDGELMLRQALARTLEAAGDTASAFAHWQAGKAAKKTAVGYTIEEDGHRFREFERLFSADSLSDQRPGALSARPVFVIGMPRSGTTLVERMLASHSAVTSGGELGFMPQAFREAGGARSPLLIDPGAIGAVLAKDPAWIGNRYLELADMVVGDADRFIDKLPLNFFFVGLIRRVLPNAKIVCMRRNPLDTCLANFRQLFAINFRYYRYALSLADTAEYYAMFERLMRHWDGLFPGRIFRVQYERLVDDTESEVRRLLEFLDLDFESSVLEFAANPTPVATASAAQVRRPVYRGSVGAWKRYEAELAPLRRQLDALGIDPLGSG